MTRSALPRVDAQLARSLVGQKAPLKLKDVWAIRARLQFTDRVRDLASRNALETLSVMPATIIEVRRVLPECFAGE